MHDFTLTLVASSTDYLIHAACPLVGEAGPQTIKRADLANLSLAGERLSSDDINDVASAGQIGRGLYQTIFQNRIHELFQRALAVASDQSAGLRILLKFEQSPELHEIPWELLHDGRQFLATNPATPIVRYLEQPERVRSLEVEPPLYILFTTACPENQFPLDLVTEERNLRRALEPLGEAVKLIVEHRISLSKLRRTLMRAQERERPFHIWHHCGHGGHVSQHDTPGFRLVLEDQKATQWVDVAQISTLVRACPSLRLVTLNVCHSGSSIGLGPALASLNVPAVVGFRSFVFDEAALTFAEAFYEAMFYNPIDVALSQARMALAIKNSQALDWTLPLLFLRTTNPILLARHRTEHRTLNDPAEAVSDTTRSGPVIKVHADKVIANKVRVIGVEIDSDKSPDLQPDLNLEVDAHSVETGDYQQIGIKSVSSRESPQYFEPIQHLAHSLTNDLAADAQAGQDPSKHKFLTKLYQILITYFDEDELRTLCSNLSIDYDKLPSTGKMSKARDLVTYLERHGLFSVFLREGKRMHPYISWDDAFS